MTRSTGWIVALLFLAASVALAQTPAPAPAPQPAPSAMECQQMMEKMHASMKTMDNQLQPLVEKMNAATGTARTEAAIAVINELVRQRSAMRDQMMAMMPQMMCMKDCPMIRKGMQAEHH